MLRSKQNEGDSSILVSNLYISKCHAKCKHWELYKLDELYSLINLIKLDKLYRTEKEKGNGIYVISTNLKFKSYVCTEHDVTFMWCVGQWRKNYHTKKGIMSECICFSNFC